jgi:hypothetical protein
MPMLQKCDRNAWQELVESVQRGVVNIRVLALNLARRFEPVLTPQHIPRDDAYSRQCNEHEPCAIALTAAHVPREREQRQK